MKTFRKSIALALSVLMLASVMAVAGVSAFAAEGDATSSEPASTSQSQTDPAETAAGTAETEPAETASSQTVIYFINTPKWDSVYAYTYNGAQATPSWPGTPATLVDSEKGVYSFDSGDCEFIIFNNNNNGLQTANLNTAGNYGKYYEPQTAKFYNTVDEALEATKSYVPAKYYVIGEEALLGNNWLLKDTTTAMTSLDKDTFVFTIENVKAGTYQYKVNNGTWDESYPEGMENASVTVNEDGSTVTIILNPSRGYPLAGVNEIPTYPAVEPTESVAPTEAQEQTVPPTTPPVAEGKAQVTVTSNVAGTKSETYDLSLDKKMTVQLSLKAAQKIINGQGFLEYDSKVLKVESFTMPNVSNAVINTDLADLVKFNYTDCQGLYDFTSTKVFAEVTFSVAASGSTAVKFNLEELNGTGADGDVAYVTDGVKAADFEAGLKLSAPTQAATKAPSPKLSASKINKNAGDTYKIKVANQPKGTKLSFTSNKKNVAKVSSSGKVTALTKGKAVITVKIKKGSSVVKTLKLTVNVKNNPKLSPAKKLTIKKVNKTAAVKITGKASSVKNSYKVADKRIAKIVTKNKNAKKITVKGLKRGSTTVTIKVNGKALKLKVTVK